MRLSRLIGILVLVLGATTAARADQSDINRFGTGTNSGNNVASLSTTLNIGGQNKYLIVGLGLANNTNAYVTYNSGAGNVGMTRLVRQASTGSNVIVELWGFIAPVNATPATVTVNVSTSSDIVVGAACYNNVNQTTPIASQGSTSGTAATATIATASAARQVIFDVIAVDVAPNISQDLTLTNNICDLSTTGGTGGGTETVAVSEQPGVTQNVSYTGTGGNRWAIAYAVLQAPTGAPTAVKWVDAKVQSVNGHAQVAWRTGSEIDNLGFRVYKDDGRTLALATPDLIAGSALTVSSKKLPRGRAYLWNDPDPLVAGIKYWIEDVDLSGKKTRHGPYAVQAGPGGAGASSPILKALSRKTPKHRGTGDIGPVTGAPAVGAAPTAAKTAQSLPPSTLAVSAGIMPYLKALPPPDTAALAMQQALAGRAAIKLSVSGGGLYRVLRTDLLAAGLPANAAPDKLQLFANGREAVLSVHAIRASPFWDAIEFYGIGQDTTWTDARAYWLIWGDAKGLRAPVTPQPGSGKSTATSFAYAVERHDRTIYVAQVHNGEADNFYGPALSGSPVDQVLATPHPDTSPGRSAIVTVILQGFNDSPHAVALALNGKPLGVQSFTGRARSVGQYKVPIAYLNDGDSTLRLTGSSDEDASGVETLRIDYPHTYVADSDQLAFAMVGGTHQTIGGFTSSAIRVFDVTDPWKWQEVTGKVTAVAGKFQLALLAPGVGLRSLMAFAGDRAQAVAAVSANAASSWNALTNRGAMLIFAHGTLVSALEPLRSRRAGQLGSAVVVDVEDAYDEFNFGAKSPYALRDLLTRARSWATPPRFVLFVGDSTFDPRNYAQEDFSGPLDFDLVPTKIVDTSSMETASDDWFTDTNGDGVADLPVGRLPLRTAAEVTTVVNKLIAYETAVADPAWTRRAELVADAPDGKTDFDANSAFTGGALPQGWTQEVLAVGSIGAGAVRDGIFSALNAGCGLITYFGHAGQDFWSDTFFLTAYDTPSMPATAKLPVIAALTCLDGLYNDIFVDCMAKTFIKAPGACVAFFGCTGFVEPDGQPFLGRAFVAALAGGATFGDAAIAAKRAVTDQDLKNSWMLFGDPSMKLR